jgi:hypothetical protein
LRVGVVASAKIGHHFRKQIDVKIEVIKNVNIKKISPKFVFFNEKKSEKFR